MGKCLYRDNWSYICDTLAEVLWYVDGNFQTLHDRGCGIPEMFSPFQGYNKPELRKKRRRDEGNLKASELAAYSSSLFTLASSSYPITQQWHAVYEAVLRFADNLRKYVTYLETKNREMQEHNEKKTCASQLGR